MTEFWNHPTYFNPRPREGSDDSQLRSVAKNIDFNPRPREGSD